MIAPSPSRSAPRERVVVPSPSRSAPLRPLPAAPAALALVLLWLLVPARAGAVEGWGVSAPPPGGTVTGAAQIAAFAAAGPEETIDAVRARLVGPAGRLVALSHRDGPLTGGTSNWSGQLDPLGGEALPNGTYRVEVQVQASGPEGPKPETAWNGYEVQVRVPPPATAVRVAATNPSLRSIDVQWDPVALPDFMRYELQRAGPDGEFTTVGQFAAIGATRTVDAPPTAGEYRYRIRVVRSDGAGGELGSESPAAAVVTDGGPPSDEGSPDPEATATDDPEAGDGTSGPGRDGTAGPSFVPGRAVPPRIQLPQAQTQTRPDPVTAPDPVVDDVFEPNLPFDETRREVARGDLQSDSTREGGTLAVLTERPDSAQAYRGIALGLLLIVIGGHLRWLIKTQFVD